MYFPAINWLNSYSLYVDSLSGWYTQNVSKHWGEKRKTMMKLLQQESELDEIVKLVGIDTLSSSDRLVLETSRSIREDYLHQNAFHEIDTFTSFQKQDRLLNLILCYHQLGIDALKNGVSFKDVTSLPIREKIGRAKYIPEDIMMKEFDEIEKQLNLEISNVTALGGNVL